MLSLTALRAFDLVARRGSFSDAARELNVTRPAVSKQIKNLEVEIGCQLVIRSRPKVALTEEGRHLAHGLRQGFDLITATAQHLIENRTRPNMVRILVERDFASAWLAERIGEFLVVNPGISVEITADKNGRLRMEEDFSFRIFYGDVGAFASDDLDEHALCEWIDVPLCTPEYAASHMSVDTLYPTAHFLIDKNYDPWDDWFETTGVARPAKGALRTQFSETSLCLAATVASTGITIGDSVMCLSHIETGRLIAPFKTGLHSSQRYAIYRPRSRALSTAEIRFSDWLFLRIQQFEDRVETVFRATGIEILNRTDAQARGAVASDGIESR